MDEFQSDKNGLEFSKNNTIPLLNLENIFLNYNSIFKRKYDFIKISQEQKEQINKLEKDCFELYYKIDEQKNKELKSVFEQIKLRIKFNEEPKFLKEGILYTTDGGFYIYNKKYFKKLFNIQMTEDYNIIHAIQLENKDLILIMASSSEIDYKILIYRFKDGKFSLLQTIEENKVGFADKYETTGGCGNSIHLVGYYIQFIKEISWNRFIIASNYGFKLYSLNKNNEYSLVLLEDLENIEFIYEINENKFIFGVKKLVERISISYYSVINFKIIELTKITESEINNKIKTKKDNDNNGYFRFRLLRYGFLGDDDNNIEKKMKKTINIISSLQLSCTTKNILETDKAEFPNLYNNIILKNKYLIFMMDNNIVIFDLIELKIIKKYKTIIIAEDHIILFKKMELKKWSSKDDNEFILIIFENIILFELKEEKDEIKIKIINQKYFYIDENNEEFIKKYEKLTKDENKFYIYDKKIKNNSFFYVHEENQNKEIIINIY